MLIRTLTRWAAVVLVLVVALGGGGGCTEQMRKARHLSKGDRDFAAERYDLAEIEYLKVLRFEPPDPHAISRLGIIYCNRGQWAHAMLYLQKAIEIEPTNTEARVKLGRGALVFQQFKKAHEQALTVLAQEPDNGEALLLLAGSPGSAQEVAQTEQVFARVSSKGRTQPGYHLARGTLYLHEKDLAKAEAEYRQELELDPKSSQACLALGNLFLLRQDLKAAEPLLKQAAELAPLYSSARLTYASLKLQTGARQEALNDVQELVKKAPDFLPAWLFLARAAVAQGKVDESAAYVQKVLARDSFNFEALSLNGSLLLLKGDGTNAASQFERIIRDYSPPPPETYYNLALACVLNNDIAKAVVNLNRALALQTNYVDAILLLANLNVRLDNSAAAIASLSGLVERQPRVAQAHLALATAYIAQKNYNEAAAVYHRMGQVFTNSGEVPFYLGSLLLLQNKPDEARQAFEKSLAIAPAFLPAIEQLVDLDLQQNRAAEATRRVNLLIEKYPKAAALYVLRARIHIDQAKAVVARENQKNGSGAELRLGDVPAAREDVNQAEEALLKAIEISPDHRPAHQVLASLYVNSNRAQQAIDRLKGLTNDTACLLEMGDIQQQMQDYPAARNTYQQVLKAQPDAIDALNNLAFLYAEHLGQLDRGCQLAEQARQLQPNNAYVAETLGWILCQRGQYGRALSLLLEAAGKLPPSQETQYHLGLTHYMLGEEEPARAALQRATAGEKDFTWKPQALRFLAWLALDVKSADAGTVVELKKRLREAPNDIVVLERLAAIQERDGAFEQAAQTYETALSANPVNLQPMLKLGQLYDERLNNSKRALDLARQAHAQSPDDPRVSRLLGRLAYRSGDYRWAQSLLQESARELPGDPALLYDLAWSQYSIGQVAEAKASMRSASLATLPALRASEAKRFLELVAAANSPAGAEQALPEARAILVTNAEYVPALMVSAVVQEKQGKFSDAAQLYETILRRFPLFAPAVRALGLVSFDQLGDDQRAYPFAVKAREFFPADAEVARMLGVLTYRRGDYSHAAPLLAESALQKTHDGELLYYLGMAHYGLKQLPQSKDALQRALALNVPAKLADEANRVLKELK